MSRVSPESKGFNSLHAIVAKCCQRGRSFINEQRHFPHKQADLSLSKMDVVTGRMLPAVVGRNAAFTPVHVRAAFMQAQNWLSTDAASASVSKESNGSEDAAPLSRPDPFLSHLQHKTENDLLDLLARKEKDDAYDDVEDDKMVHS